MNWKLLNKELLLRPFFPGFDGRGVRYSVGSTVSHVLAALHTQRATLDAQMTDSLPDVTSSARLHVPLRYQFRCHFHDSPWG